MWLWQRIEALPIRVDVRDVISLGADVPDVVLDDIMADFDDEAAAAASDVPADPFGDEVVEGGAVEGDAEPEVEAEVTYEELMGVV